MTITEGRIERRFAALADQNRAGFVAFITAGDPDLETAQALLNGLPGAGADIIELGMPFTDPMADGPSIQASSLRALAAGQTMIKTLDMVRAFRKTDTDTPIILMGYYNPIYHYGVEAFVTDAHAAGVDGLIIVDLPAEEDAELCQPALAGGLRFIRLLTPTTDDTRLDRVLENTSGFLYYVSIAGITGAAIGASDAVAQARARFAAKSPLPVAVGFGIKTPDQAAAMARVADAVVVGSAIVDRVAALKDGAVQPVLDFTAELAWGTHTARETAS